MGFMSNPLKPIPLKGRSGRSSFSKQESQKQGKPLEQNARVGAESGVRCSRKKGKERRDSWKILAMESRMSHLAFSPKQRLLGSSFSGSQFPIL